MKRNYRPPPFPAVVKEAVYRAQGEVCRLFPHPGCTRTKYLDPHHIIANTKANRNRWPILIDSSFNLAWICNHGHTHFKHLLTIPGRLADVYEEWLAVLVSKAENLEDGIIWRDQRIWELERLLLVKKVSES